MSGAFYFLTNIQMVISKFLSLKSTIRLISFTKIPNNTISLTAVAEPLRIPREASNARSFHLDGYGEEELTSESDY